MVVAPGWCWVVCFYGFDVTPIKLIKKRKKLRIKIELIDVLVECHGFIAGQARSYRCVGAGVASDAGNAIYRWEQDAGGRLMAR